MLLSDESLIIGSLSICGYVRHFDSTELFRLVDDRRAFAARALGRDA